MGLMLTPLPLLMLVNLIKRLGTKKTAVIDYQKFFVRKDEPLELVCCFLYSNSQISVYFFDFSLLILLVIMDLILYASTGLSFFHLSLSYFQW